MEREVLVSRWKTPDGFVLESKNRHDYVTHKDANGDVYMVDGGRDYVRHSVNNVPMEDVSVYSDDPIEVVREHLVRYSMNGPVLLKDMTPEHLVACVRYNEERGLGLDCVTIQYMRELVYRYEKGLI